MGRLVLYQLELSIDDHPAAMEVQLAVLLRGYATFLRVLLSLTPERYRVAGATMHLAYGFRYRFFQIA